MKDEVSRRSNIDSFYYFYVDSIKKENDGIIILSSNNCKKFKSKNIINATYA
jgi:L-2-hydroxyglutarate oxidase LhgO